MRSPVRIRSFRLSTQKRTLSGRSSVRKNACLGSMRPRVRIPPFRLQESRRSGESHILALSGSTPDPAIKKIPARFRGREFSFRSGFRFVGVLRILPEFRNVPAFEVQLRLSVGIVGRTFSPKVFEFLRRSLLEFLETGIVSDGRKGSFLHHSDHLFLKKDRTERKFLRSAETKSTHSICRPETNRRKTFRI